MRVRTTFEDRLLDELKREIELREAGAGEGEANASVRHGRGSGPLSARRSRPLTARRILVVAAACAAAWLGAVVVPGSPAASKAYAVERHGDGSVTLTVNDQAIDVEAQRELARALRPNGIEVTVDVLAPGYLCKDDPVFWGHTMQGDRVPVYTLQWSRETTLRPGNVLAFVNVSGGDRPHKVDVYASRADVEPCVPVKPVPPGGPATD